jgi:hypothetical protein
VTLEMKSTAFQASVNRGARLFFSAVHLSLSLPVYRHRGRYFGSG